MEIAVLLRGLIIGLLIAAPIGPINVLCIQRTLAKGKASGLVTGLGAATADTIYGGIAGFGVSAIANFLISQQAWFRLIGGLLLGYWGFMLFYAKPAQQTAVTQDNGLLNDYVSTFFLTLTNPMTIVAFAGVFAGLGLVNPGNYLATIALIVGVFLGSQLWWCILTMTVGVFHIQGNMEKLRLVNQVAGVTLIGLGVMALVSMV